MQTGNQPARFHLLASGVGRESVASSCRTFANFISCACLLVMQTRSRSKSPDSRSSATAPATKAKKATATPAPAATDATDQLPPQSLTAPSASTAAGLPLTDRLANQRMDTLAAKIEAGLQKQKDLLAELERDKSALQLLLAHPQGDLPEDVRGLFHERHGLREGRGRRAAGGRPTS